MEIPHALVVKSFCKDTWKAVVMQGTLAVMVRMKCLENAP